MMLIPVTSTPEWVKKYGIQDKGLECPKCSHSLNLTKPIAIKGYRGLAAEPCEQCGEDSEIVRLVPVDPKKIELWESLRP